MIDGITLAPVYRTGAVAAGASGLPVDGHRRRRDDSRAVVQRLDNCTSGVTAITGYATAAARVGLPNWSTYGTAVACSNSFRLCLEQ
ncbi:MAG: hypothetical protein R3B99_07700 [Polyangiales bacterium]